MPLTAEDRLVLIRVKIERAKKHLDEMEGEAASLGGQNMYVVGPHFDPHTGNSSLNLAPLPVLPFNVIAAAGDIVQNLRSALDHLAYHLAQIGLSGGEPHRDVSFPIGASAAIYESRKRRKVQGMRKEAVEAIDRLKPYKGGNDALWRLHELNNIDKHRTLFTVGHDHLFVGGFGGGYWLKASNPIFSGIIERIIEPEPYENFQFKVEKPLSELTVLKSQALIPTLHQLVDFVESLVASFEPLLE